MHPGRGPLSRRRSYPALLAGAGAFALACATFVSAAAIPIRKLALVDARTGAIDTRFADRRIPSEAPSTNTGIVADGRGGWFATSPTGVVRLLHNGRIDSSWHGRIGGSAVSLTRFGSTIYVGLQPKPNAFRLAALDVGTGNLRWESAVYSGRKLVTLAADDAGIFAGGTMPKPGASDIGVEYSPWLMRFDPRTGALVRSMFRRPGQRSTRSPSPAIAFTWAASLDLHTPSSSPSTNGRARSCPGSRAG